METVEDKAIEAYEENQKQKKKYQVEDDAWMDWFTMGYEQAEKDNKADKDDIRIHLNPNYYGNKKYYFTKDDKHCLCVEYNPNHDWGEGSPSGAMIESVEIHTNNSFNFTDCQREISISDVPECILELLTYLK